MGTSLTVTILLTVWSGDDPERLHACLEAIGAQTRPADQILVVRDGPVGPETERVVRDWVSRSSVASKYLAVERNSGRWAALNLGLDHVASDCVAIQDADDLMHPQRLERQLELLTSDVDVVGAYMIEVDAATGACLRLRVAPSDHEGIVRALRWNNPVNNPTAVIRTALLRQVGGYRDVHLMEDYDLFVRLYAAGARFATVPTALIAFPVDSSFYRRRGGRRFLSSELQMSRLRRATLGTSSWTEIAVVAVRAALRLTPAAVRRTAYSRSNQYRRDALLPRTERDFLDSRVG